VTGYLDSSVLLRKLFGEPNSYSQFDQFSTLISSSLLKTECLRVFSRLRLSGTVSQENLLALQTSLQTLLQSVNLIAVSQEILDRAGEDFPAPLKTLDAIHYSTFLNFRALTGEETILLTHDIALARTARAMGLPAEGC
jgi:predicted nucleic acid-binding protein